nr:ABC transporter ATP-binding protein [Brucella anthropi]
MTSRGANVKGAKLEFKNVKKSYGHVVALSDFNLAVEPGEFVSILGASGSGKTTALNALAGFAFADSGQILLDGEDISFAKPERRNLGMVFQNYSLFPHMTVLENVIFPLKMRGLSKSDAQSKASAALDVVQLQALASRYPKELSGGQQQRVALARAIVFEPRVLLMDEPLGALDLKLREAMQYEIKQIQHKLGCTVIYVTHDQHEALALSSRIAVLRNGVIEQLDTPTNLYDAPRTRYVAEFIGQNNIFDTAANGHKVSIPDLAMTIDTPANPFKFACIRPENWQRKVSTASDGVSATVDEVTFQGDSVEYSAKLKTGNSVIVKESRRLDLPEIQRGLEVILGASPEHVVFVI